MDCCIKPLVSADMVCTELEITIISATDLKPPKYLKLKAYGRVSIRGGTEQQTPVDRDNGTNPALHFNTTFPIDDSKVRYECTMLLIKLYCRRLILKDKYIGEVHVPLMELKNRAVSGTVDYGVKKGSVYSKGTLKFSYRFGGTRAVKKSSFRWIKRVLETGTACFSVGATCLAMQ